MKVLTHLLPILLGLSSAQISQAEIYKYKDEKGRWHYTDRKPVGKKGVEIVKTRSAQANTTSEAKSRDNWVKLEEQLTNRFRPQNAAQTASLAVVSVRTSVGSGSGFFVTGEGHIITNRHVVRPDTSTGWQQQEEELNNEEQRIKQRIDALEREKINLKAHKSRLDQMYDSVLHPGRYTNPISSQDYKTQEEQYKNRERRFQQTTQETRKIKAEFSRRKQDLNFSNNAASLSRNFKVYLKDGTEVAAQLVRISQKHDLALLKIDGYATPFLKSGDTATPSQTQTVFAIGSPLGQHDSITEGQVTGMQGKEILVDATILPGSSGGPLVDEHGNLLGVNTKRIIDRRFNGANGFGIAVPISAVFDEFGAIIATANNK